MCTCVLCRCPLYYVLYTTYSILNMFTSSILRTLHYVLCITLPIVTDMPTSYTLHPHHIPAKKKIYTSLPNTTPGVKLLANPHYY